MNKVEFKSNFMWGVASAAHQVEGSNNNSDAWLMEQLPDTMYQQISGDACDFYHRYEQDIKIVKDLGFNTFRLGIEWSRIEPVKGFYSQAELDHYHRIIDKCLENNIEPVITLHHFTSPKWLIQDGGWRNPNTADLFALYTAKVVKEYQGKVKYYCTINEANTPLQLTMNGLFTGNVQAIIDKASKSAAPYFNVSEEDFAPFFPNANDEESIQTIFKAHKLAVDAAHQADKNVKVGVTLSLQDIRIEEDSIDGQAFLDHVNNRFIDEMGAYGDFIGVQNYTRVRFNKNGSITETENLTDANITMDPTTLANIVSYTYKRSNKPIMITEHGADLSTKNDYKRVEFINASLIELQKAIEKDNLDVLGYVHWCLMDNYEWFKGYHGHYGLIEVDFKTQVRKPRPSAIALGEIAKNNKINL